MILQPKELTEQHLNKADQPINQKFNDTENEERLKTEQMVASSTSKTFASNWKLQLKLSYYPSSVGVSKSSPSIGPEEHPNENNLQQIKFVIYHLKNYLWF